MDILAQSKQNISYVYKIYKKNLRKTLGKYLHTLSSYQKIDFGLRIFPQKFCDLLLLVMIYVCCNGKTKLQMRVAIKSFEDV